MFACLSLIIVMWEAFGDLIIVGKVIMFPFFVVGTLAVGVIGLFELVVIDPFVILLTLFTKDMTIRDLFDWW